MVKGDGIGAWIDAGKGNGCGRSGRHAVTEAFGILATVREEFRVGGDANQDVALCAAQTLNIDVNSRCCRRGFNRGR